MGSKGPWEARGRREEQAKELRNEEGRRGNTKRACRGLVGGQRLFQVVGKGLD